MADKFLQFELFESPLGGPLRDSTDAEQSDSSSASASASPSNQLPSDVLEGVASEMSSVAEHVVAHEIGEALHGLKCSVRQLAAQQRDIDLAKE